jgi:hypothetical protein
VHPDIGHDGVAEGAARLGDFVFVVREDQVDAAAVDVEDFAQMLPAHGGAFDVPAGAAAAPGAVPAGRVLVRGLPQHEVHVAALVRSDVDAGTRHHLVQRAAGQLAVVLHRGNVEQHVAVRRIGVALGDEALDHGDHLRDVLGGAGLDRGRQDAQGGDVRVELACRALREIADRDPLLPRARVDLVVDVRDVAHVGDVGLAVDLAEQAEQHVEHDHRPCIADMGIIIDGGTADIHAHIRRVQGGELLLGAGQRVVEAQRHIGPRGLPARERFVLDLGQAAPCQRMFASGK